MTGMSNRNYAELAEDAYRDRLVGAQLTLGDNRYRILAFVENERSGYAGTVYQDVSSRQIIVAHRGTEPSDPKDVMTDVRMVTHRVNDQSTDALRLTDHALALAAQEQRRTGVAPEVSTTGHSLGGTLAQITAFERSLPGRSFNAYGAVEVTPGMREGQDAERFLSFYRISDPVGTGGRHYGASVPLATPKDIEVLRDIGGYNNRRGGIDIRDPFLPAVSFGLSAHSMGAFIRSEGGNPPVLTETARALAQQYDPMADKFRDDVRFVRETLGVVGRGLADTYQQSREVATEFRNAIQRGFDSVGRTAGQMRDAFMDGVGDIRERLSNPFRRSSIDGVDDMGINGHPGLRSVMQAFERSGVDGARVPREMALGLAAVGAERHGGRIDFATLSADGGTGFGVVGRSLDDPAAQRFAFNPKQDGLDATSLAQRLNESIARAPQQVAAMAEDPLVQRRPPMPG